MTPTWLTGETVPWRDTITFLAPCPGGCGADAVWRGHKTGGTIGATDTTYDGIDCPRCEGDWTVTAQAGRRHARHAAALTAALKTIEEAAA